MSFIRPTTKKKGQGEKARNDEDKMSARLAIKTMSSKHDTFLAELIRRGSQFHELLSVSYVVKVVLYRAEKGSVTQSEMDQLSPPRIKVTTEAGTEPAFEYIRDVLIDSRKTITTLYNENRALASHLAGLEREIRQHTSTDPNPGSYLDVGSLQIKDVGEILGEFEDPEDNVESSEE
jgi:ribosomal protein L27